MGILRKGIMGPVSNKVGTVIGRNFRGMNVITATYRTSSKSLNGDKAKRQYKFGMLSGFLSQLQGIVEPGFTKTVKHGQSQMNAAFSFNYKHAFVEQDDKPMLNFSKLVISRGPIEQPNCASVIREGNKVVFSWLYKGENNNCRYNDKASFVMCGIDGARVILHKHKALRSELRFEYELPEPLLEAKFQCFMVFSSYDEKLVGNSEYVGLINA